MKDLGVVGGADEALVEALEGEGEVVGVHSELMDDGGLEVADVDGVFGG